MIRRFHRAILKPERFLVVDDEEEARRRICARLEAEYGVSADGVESGQDALIKVKRGLPYGLAIIDLKLKGEHGTQVAERLKLVRPDLPVMFMSSARLVGAEAAAIDTTESLLVGKEPDEIVRGVDQLLHDRWTDAEYPISKSPTPTDAFLRQLGVSAFARQPLEERLSEVLVALRQETKVSQTLVLKLDLTRRIVSVVVAEPPCTPDILPAQSTELYFSPVQDVIEDEQEFRKNDVDPDQDARFKHFFPNLSFSSCLGIPVLIPDQVTTHALFLLDDTPWGFDVRRESRRIEQARLAAKFLAIAIERSALLDHMRRYQEMYAVGQLLATLTHEMKNKLNGLHAQAARLNVLISNASSKVDSDEKLRWLDKIQSVADSIAAAEMEAIKLLEAYERLAQRDLESVDVNEVAGQVFRQLAPLADHSSVKIILDLTPNLSRAAAIQSQLQQVIMNLVLNSIQQIQRKQEHLRRVADERGDKTCFSQDGQIIIQTRCRASGDHPLHHPGQNR